MKGHDAGIRIGLLAPAATPSSYRDVSGATNDALSNADVRNALKRQGTNPIGGTPKEFADLIRADIERSVAVLASSAQRMWDPK
jgi:tripartite-type tricarboxylate transporter receptor subunit TctC